MKRTTKFIALGLLSCSCLTGCFGKTSSKKKGSSQTKITFAEWKALAEACPYNEMKTAIADVDGEFEQVDGSKTTVKGKQYFEYSEQNWVLTKDETGSEYFISKDYVGMRMDSYATLIESTVTQDNDYYSFTFYSDFSMYAKIDTDVEGQIKIKGSGTIRFNSNGFSEYVKMDGNLGGAISQDGKIITLNSNYTIDISYSA